MENIIITGDKVNDASVVIAEIEELDEIEEIETEEERIGIGEHDDNFPTSIFNAY